MPSPDCVAPSPTRIVPPPANSEPEDGIDEAEGGSRVGIAQRAYPLIELLDWTRKEDGFVLWEAAHDF